MADAEYTSDLRIKVPVDYGEKATLTLNERGDLQLIDGRDKLSAQLIRAVVNDNAVGQSVINSPLNTRNLKILFNLILRNFRQVQIDTVNQLDPSFSGFSFYRLNTGASTTYTKVSANFVISKFTDTGLSNGTTYKYAITKAYSGKFESAFTEKISIVPSSLSSKQEIIIGTNVVGIPGDRKVDFYVTANAKYKGSELIEDILELDVQQSTVDPRMCTVNIVVQDLRGMQVPIAAVRRNPAT